MAIGQRAEDIKLHLEVYRLMGEDWGIEYETQKVHYHQGVHYQGNWDRIIQNGQKRYWTSY